MLKNKSKNKKIFIILCMLAYIVCVVVLIVEASLPGPQSANHSNTVGGIIADAINGVMGDQSKVVLPTDCEITNKIDTAYVGDTYKLDVATIPSDSKYVSYEYESENEAIATVDENGEITFICTGEVDIYAINSYNNDIIDFVTINVIDRFATQIETKIYDSDYDLLEPIDNVYNVYVNDQLYIHNIFIPENTTMKNITYIYDNQYFQFSGNGFKALKECENEIIKIKYFDLEYELIFNVLQVEIEKIDLINITAKEEAIMTLNESKNALSLLGIKFNPSNATNKDYYLESSNSDCIKITNKTIKAIGYGESIITITSKEDSNIKCSVLIKVIPIDITDFNVNISNSYENSLKVGYEYNIKITNPVPSNSTAYLNNYLEISVSNPDIIIQNNKIKVLSEVNNELITYRLNNKDINGNIISYVEKQIYISSYIPHGVDDFDFELKINNQNALDDNVIYIDSINTFELNINSYYFEGNEVVSNTIVKDYNISSDKLTINSNTISAPNMPSRALITIALTEYKISKTIELFVIAPIEYNMSTLKTLEYSDYNGKIYPLLAKEEIYQDIYYQIKLANNIYDLQSYDIKFDNENIEIESFNGYEFSLAARNNNITKMLITPIFDQILLNDEAMVIEFKILDRIINDFNLNVLDEDNDYLDLEMVDNNITINCYNKDKFRLELDFIPWEMPSLIDINIECDNLDACTINNLEINIVGPGKSIITIVDKITNISKTITINSINYIALDKDNSFEISHKDVKYDNELDIYSIVNGTSGKIKFNFKEESTYNKVEYVSSNNEVLEVSNNGIITPNKVGEATITCIIDDGISPKIVKEITIKVERTDFITDLKAFFLMVRKGLGHFSAFLVLGIASSLFFLLAFDNRKWLFSVPFNFVQGFLVAGLTELIQRFVPGRSGLWSDVWLDFSGFITSSFIITFVILLMAFIKYKKRGIK